MKAVMGQNASMVKKIIFHIKRNIINAKCFVSFKWWALKVKIRWAIVTSLLGDTLDIFRDKKYPADYVTIVDRKRKIPYGLWKKEGNTLTRIYPKQH